MTPPSPTEVLALYRTMLVIRRTEEQLAKSHQAGLIPGPCHTYVGEEAVAAGVCANLRADDMIFSTHRGHGHALAKGVSPRALIAELYGRATGVSHGRGGSMHLFAPEVGLMGTSGIVGPCILQAAGAAYTFQLLKRDQVAAAFFGDGAVNNGAFHEGLNLAAIYQLPVVFVCENNLYATEVPFAYATRNPDVASRGAAYGLPGVGVDGNDAPAVWAAAQAAVARARGGGGPTLIEARTYRTRAHAEGMRDGSYRTREEVEAWKARDPLRRLREHALAEGWAVAADLEAVEAEVKAQVEAAAAWAESSPWPDPASASAHVYSEAAHA
ncbi:MAG: thiamine pyrophosphate-dependent dehydrogenase E1 component subunit alpha [Anaerolineales bacterium]|nr:thiamine pyrophosphate-dependent dehydrogenase E1 component subunit alpha [Anaerolineales bacterium]